MAFGMLAAVACGGARTAATAGAEPERRFHDPQDVVLADSGAEGLTPRGAQAFPHYPDAMRESGRQAALVIAYVVDTTGRIEFGTIAFLEPVAPEFQRAMCEWRTRVRYSPLRVNGHPKRALVFQAHAFGLGPAPERSLPDLAAPYRARMRTLPREEIFARLESLPHC